MGDNQVLRNLVGEESDDSEDPVYDIELSRKPQGRHELRFYPPSGKREEGTLPKFQKEHWQF